MIKTINYLTILPTDSLGGGAEQLLYNVLEHNLQAKRKCKIIFLSKKKSGRWSNLEKDAQITYLPFNNVYFGYLALIPIMVKLSITNTIEKTFTSQTLINSMMGLLKRISILKNTKVIVRESNSIFHLLTGFKLKMYQFAYNLGYPGVDLVICQTNYMKNELLKGAPWMDNKIKIVVLNNPINLNLIEKNSMATIEMELPDNYIAAAGRLSPVKGFDILIAAFKILLKEFPELTLVILGEGKERPYLEKLIYKYRLNDHVLLPGFVDNVYPYFKHAKMCVVSSRIEGFPNVLLQMMSQNEKVVSTKSAGGIDEIPGIFTCNVNDTKDLANSMKKCLLTKTGNFRHEFDLNLMDRTLKKFMDSILVEL